MLLPGLYKAIYAATIERCRRTGEYNISEVVDSTSYKAGEKFEIPEINNGVHYRVKKDLSKEERASPIKPICHVTGKIRYIKKEECKKVLSHILGRFDCFDADRLHIYLCDHCHDWHVGKTTRPLSREERSIEIDVPDFSYQDEQLKKRLRTLIGKTVRLKIRSKKIISLQKQLRSMKDAFAEHRANGLEPTPGMFKRMQELKDEYTMICHQPAQATTETNDGQV